MSHVDGNDNYTIEGNNSHIGDLTQNIDTLNIYNSQYENNKEDVVKEKELDPFFEIGLQKTPGLNFIFGYSFLFIFIGLNYLQHMFGLAFEYFIAFLLSSAFGWYWLYSLAQVKFFDMIYIKENEVVRGQASYSYDLIRVNDIRVNNGRIDFGFIDNAERMLLDMKDDAAGLLKHKIEEYHRFHNEKR